MAQRVGVAAWSQGVGEECHLPHSHKKKGQMQKASAIVGRGLDSPQHPLFQGVSGSETSVRCAKVA